MIFIYRLIYNNRGIKICFVTDGRQKISQSGLTDNLFFFCHFGVECVLLSRLLDCSPVVLWHHTVALTSSVTKLTTEERREGKAIFRMSQFGSLSHLDGAGEEPSFFARFCETCHDGTRED